MFWCSTLRSGRHEGCPTPVQDQLICTYINNNNVWRQATMCMGTVRLQKSTWNLSRRHFVSSQQTKERLICWHFLQNISKLGNVVKQNEWYMFSMAGTCIQAIHACRAAHGRSLQATISASDPLLSVSSWHIMCVAVVVVLQPRFAYHRSAAVSKCFLL